MKKLKDFILGVLSVSSTWSIRMHTGMVGTLVGTDSLGNRYFTGKPRGGSKQQRRFVIYAHMEGGRGYDASQVPPEWHGWLHHQTNSVPAAQNSLRHVWQQAPQANMTGTVNAYFPPGHTLGGGQRDKATGDYTAWQPPV